MKEYVKEMKEKILKEEARLIRLKKQGYNVERLLEKIKEIKLELHYMEAREVRISKQSPVY